MTNATTPEKLRATVEGLRPNHPDVDELYEQAREIAAWRAPNIPPIEKLPLMRQRGSLDEPDSGAPED